LGEKLFLRFRLAVYCLILPTSQLAHKKAPLEPDASFTSYSTGKTPPGGDVRNDPAGTFNKGISKTAAEKVNYAGNLQRTRILHVDMIHAIIFVMYLNVL